MDDARARHLGRLAIGDTNDDVVAYYAMPDTMAFARRLGSIRKDLIDPGDPNGPTRYREFVALMQRCVEDIIEQETGARPTWTTPAKELKDVRFSVKRPRPR